MCTILNILNFILGGFATTLGWLLATLVSIILIVTLPLTRSCWEITRLSLFPYGNEAIHVDELEPGRKNGLLNAGGTVLNILWFIFFGWWLCLMHIFSGIAQCLTIIGIPVGIANFKIAAIALWRWVAGSFLWKPRVLRVKPMRVVAFSNRTEHDMISPLLRRYTWNSAWLYNVRIFIALCGTTLFPWWIGEVKLTIPLTLGVVAAALTDLDDRLAGRLRNLAITLVCFFIASASVELRFPWPPLFALGLTVSTIGFILLGGLGQRYATIAFGALLIAIYTMLGVTLYDHWYLQPLFLLAGAVWYNLLTLSGHLIFPIRPLQDNLARSYEQLARYLELKSRLFDPDLEDESQAPLYDLALANGQLVATLNQTKGLAANPTARRSGPARHPPDPAVLLCGPGYS